jgi:hypothetical protein
MQENRTKYLVQAYLSDALTEAEMDDLLQLVQDKNQEDSL